MDSSNNKNLNTQRASGMPDMYDSGSKQYNLAVTTTNVSVYSNGMKVGYVQSASPSESRPLTKVQALGVEGVVQIVPGNTNGGQISVSRLAVYNSNLFNSLGLTRNGQFVPSTTANFGKDSTTKDTVYGTYNNPFKTLKDQRVALEIQIKTVQPNGAGAGTTLVETYLDCWLSSYSKTIASNAITITEQATIQYSDVSVTMV